MTAGLLAFGRDVAIGRQHGDANWKARRTAPDLVAAVAKAADDPDEFVDLVRPPHAEYVALQKALDDLNGQKEKGGWVKRAVRQVRRRLRAAAAGERTPETGIRDGIRDQAGSGTRDLQAAVKSFQELHSIAATGVVDDKTLAALNVPLDWRIQQVAINLQRWRYMPDDLGERHFLVNIPYFHLIARESGKPVMDIRVVVGKPGITRRSSARTWRPWCSARIGIFPTRLRRTKLPPRSRAIRTISPARASRSCACLELRHRDASMPRT